MGCKFSSDDFDLEDISDILCFLGSVFIEDGNDREITLDLPACMGLGKLCNFLALKILHIEEETKANVSETQNETIET